MNLRRTVVIVLVIVACTGTAILFLSKPQVAILKHNGDMLTLEKVTFGTNHIYSDRSPILTELAQSVKKVPFLGKLIRLPSKISTTSTGDSVALWFSEFNTQSNLYVEPRWQAVQVIDEHGCILFSADRGYNRGEGSRKIRCAVLNVWPRNQKEFAVNIFDQFYQDQLPVATFTVRNPNRIKRAVTPVADTLPAEAVAGPVTVRLAKILVQDRAPRPPSLAPEFEFIEQGEKSRDWTWDDTIWSDSAGNRAWGYFGQATLCPHEPVWKLTAGVIRKARAEFPPQNVWRLPSLKLPAAGQCSALSFKTNLHGARLSILGIAGPGKVVYSNGVPVEATASIRKGSGMSTRTGRIEVESDQHHLALDCVGLGRDQRLDLRCRQLPGGKAGSDMHMTSSSGSTQFYSFKPAPDTEAIEVELIVHPRHRVEFAFKPQIK